MAAERKEAHMPRTTHQPERNLPSPEESLQEVMEKIAAWYDKLLAEDAAAAVAESEAHRDQSDAA
jgi:hypothetical protein